MIRVNIDIRDKLINGEIGSLKYILNGRQLKKMEMFQERLLDYGYHFKIKL